MAETEEQFQGVLELFPYQDKEITSSPYPRQFPFSGMVEQVYSQLQAFVRNCTDYADGLDLRYILQSLSLSLSIAVSVSLCLLL